MQLNSQYNVKLSDKFNFCVTKCVMQQSDNLAISNGCDAKELMLRAAIAMSIEIDNIKDKLTDNSQSNKILIAIVCGKGNNGGDGHALAMLLIEKGFDVHVYSAESMTKSNIYYRNNLVESGVAIYRLNEIPNKNNYDITIDCLFGIGYCGEVSKEHSCVIEWINKGSNIIACDIPSGLDSDSGVAAKTCVCATTTIAVQAVKSGHLLNDGKDYCGNIKIADIGIDIVGDKIKIADNSLFNKVFVKRKFNTHKGSNGAVGIVACSKNSVGSGMLSATACTYAMAYRGDDKALSHCRQYSNCRDCEIYVERAYADASLASNNGECAMRVGAGLGKLFVPDYMMDTMLHRVLHCTLNTFEELNSCKLSAIAFGMGVGLDCEMLPSVLAKNIPTIIDADGLNILSNNLDLLDVDNSHIIITPHPLEFSRLTGKSTQDILSDPISHAVEFAKKHNIVLLLKGCSTIITDGNQVCINTAGSPVMAKGGSGDVLSGIIVGLLAQGVDEFIAAVLGAYILGRAGEYMEEKFGQYAALATDMSKAVLKVMVDEGNL